MAETITAREANQQFSRLLDGVARGSEYVVTRNGVAVARIVPERGPDGQRQLTAEQEDALTALIDQALSLSPQPDAEPGPFDREALYAERFERPPPAA